MTKESPKDRGNTATSESRAENEKRERQRKDTDSKERNKFRSLSELIEKMKGQVHVCVRMIVDTDSCSVSFLSLKFGIISKINYCLRVNIELGFHITCNGCTILTEHIKSVNLDSTLSTCLEIKEIIKYLESYSNGSLSASNYTKMATELLNCALDESNDEIKCNKIGFLIDQLELLEKDPNGRRYSSELVAMSFMWLKSSTASYKQILNDGVLTLPSIRHLQRLGNALTVDLDFSPGTVTYLKVKVKTLTSREKVTALVIDEVYTAKRVEYTGGRFYGNENDGITRTLLCIMIKSLCGKYNDMIALHPITSIDSDKIKTLYFKVLKGVSEVGFEVCATLVDGHRTNMKFYREISGGEMKISVSNPYNNDEPNFLLFDTTHLFKNFYTNFLNKKFMFCSEFPPFEKVEASFDHVVKLHEIEIGKSVKYAHKLNDKCLNPAAKIFTFTECM